MAVIPISPLIANYPSFATEPLLVAHRAGGIPVPVPSGVLAAIRRLTHTVLHDGPDAHPVVDDLVLLEHKVARNIQHDNEDMNPNNGQVLAAIQALGVKINEGFRRLEA